MLPNVTPLKQRIEEGSMPIPETGCWIWMLGCSSKGYGYMKVKGKQVGTHRISYQVFIKCCED